MFSDVFKGDQKRTLGRKGLNAYGLILKALKLRNSYLCRGIKKQELINFTVYGSNLFFDVP